MAAAQRWFGGWIFTIILFWANTTAAQTQPSVFQALTTTENAPLTLTLDLTTLIANKKEGAYQNGTLTAPDGATFKIEVRARGRYRRKIAVWPPLKLKFDKSDLQKAGYAPLNDIKVSLPCYDNQQGNELVVREYLAYRMFEQLAPAGSLRARLVQLTLRDTNGGKTTDKTVTAMFIEDIEECAGRLNGKAVEEFGLAASKYQLEQAAMMVMFQYFVGNTDWDLSMSRNLRLIKPLEKGAKVLAVPYDFDFSGFVNAPYATPAVESKLRNVRDRHLKPGVIPQEALSKALETLRAEKETLLKWCAHPNLSPATAQECAQYLRFFFEELEGKNPIPEKLIMR